MATPVLVPFRPMFIWPTEYAYYGLPNSTQQPDIDNIVQTASGAIDQFCGRLDSDGNGSLVYNTCQQRINNQSPGRNLVLLPFKPLVALSSQQQITLSGYAVNPAFQTALGLTLSGNYFYTGFLPSINILNDGRCSAIIGASGRYTYPRRDTYPLQSDPYGQINPLYSQTFFGGPPPWIPLDMVNLDYSELTGEMWYAAGIWLNRYTEIVVQYSSGFDPMNLPGLLKQITAAAVKNLLGMGGGATGIKQLRVKSSISVEFQADFLDDNLKQMLQPFVSVRAY